MARRQTQVITPQGEKTPAGNQAAVGGEKRRSESAVKESDIRAGTA